MELHEVERIRRSVAMLRPGQPALQREETLRILGELADIQDQLRTDRAGTVTPSIYSRHMTYDEALKVITAYCGDRPRYLWDDELPIAGKPLLYVPFEEPTDPPADAVSSGLCILADVDGALVLLHVGLTTATVEAVTTDGHMRLILSEQIYVEVDEDDA